MRIGRLRHRITLQSPDRNSRNAFGEVDLSWTDQATVWANVEPVSARERIGGAQVVGDVSHTVRIRYRSDIRPDWRIVFEDRTLHIEGIINSSERDRVMDILCSETV